MKKVLFYTLILFSIVIFSQNGITKQFEIKSDNDLYSSRSKDRYYTNGLFLSYSYLSKKEPKKAIKKIKKITLGQQLYSPFKSVVTIKEEHDRPFAGYLFGKFSFSNFYKNNTILTLNTQIGILGPGALGSETMQFIHNIYGFEPAQGWKYQIANAFALNFGAKYIKNIPKLSGSVFAMDWLSNINLGSVFTNLSTGLNIRIGLKSLKKINKSIAYEGNLTKLAKNNKEFYFFIKPLIHYKFYDATIQGSFLNENSPITYEINPAVVTTEFGISYATNNINFGYSLVFHSKKLDSDNVPQFNKYGSLFINCAF